MTINQMFLLLLIIDINGILIHTHRRLLNQVGQTHTCKVVTPNWWSLVATGFFLSQTETTKWVAPFFILIVEYKDVAPLQYRHVAFNFYFKKCLLQTCAWFRSE